MSMIKRALPIAVALSLLFPLSGCGAVALALVAYEMGKDTNTHVQTCSAPNDKGETVCHDTDNKGITR